MSFNKILNQKIRIQFLSEMGQSHNAISNNEMNEVPIILITRYRKGFLSKKRKFFNVVIDGTEISYTNTNGIILAKIDEIWPKGKYVKQAFCASDGGESQLNEIRRDWFSGKKMLGFDFEKCKV
ncbi:hypothetical protein niasHS_017333 [Heterodera schachtii]|uniref:Uncharacterized protein n=1 Tax=Heterodera schachtii TaxID=97005 RepID=A0ABD2HP81_HETSC